MFPFPYTGLRLVHDEKVRDAMERARIHAELACNPRRTIQLSLLRNVLMRIRSRLNIFTQIMRLRRWPRPSRREMRATVVNRAAMCCLQAALRDGVLSFTRL
jgi:hypothetical protein